MKRRYNELPLTEPIFSTYHNQGTGAACIVSNPSIRNWYLNNAVSLNCNRKFLSGYTSPEIQVPNSMWGYIPHFETLWTHDKYIKQWNAKIRHLIDEGYYVSFHHVDDYYVPGKSWYHERHFLHDGLICGYNQDQKTYCIYAYDSHWVYQKFWTPQRRFNYARYASRCEEKPVCICAIRPKKEPVFFSPQVACENILKYLRSEEEMAPPHKDDNVYGIVVHEYIAAYLDRLENGAIPHERMDRRVFRLIWEQKKAMLERITLLEQLLQLDSLYSEQYQALVAEANTMRLLYATYHMKQRANTLPIIQKKLLGVMAKEEHILSDLLVRAEKNLSMRAAPDDESMEKETEH